jgi:predicted acylesterase/phospholipase RssA
LNEAFSGRPYFDGAQIEAMSDGNLAAKDGFSIYRTRFYSDCIGVFQGGGCRAAAFAGAYQAVFDHGVRFSELAGTSAGSIVAALIAAGGEPDFVLSEIRSLDFTTMLVKATRPVFLKPSRLLSILRHIPFKGTIVDSIVEASLVGGLYSSEGIERWVDSRLQKLLGKRNRSIEFQDLQMQLHVVAGNLDAMKARIWSSRITPAYSVAHAVRASCTMPLFFQPVEEGNTLLVDGGIVSNLPLFVFSGSNFHERGHGQRILLFMLEASEERQRADNIKELMSQLVSLSIDGGTDVQLSFASDVARIVIPTGNVRATDFNSINPEKVDQLIQNGRNAAENFIRSELFSARAASMDSSIFDEHEAYLRVAEQIHAAKSEVVVALTDTRWFWELFPTVYKWRRTDIRIVCLVLPLNASSSELPKERQRRRLMEGLGVILAEVPALPFRGFLIDKAENSTSTGVIYLIERSDYEPVARFYSGRIDRVALAAIHDLVPDAARKAPGKGRANSVNYLEPEILLRRLRENVQFYRDPTVSLQVEEIDVSKVCLISRYVRAFRYQQIGSLIEEYRRAKLKLFEPAQIPLLGGDFSIVTPPVVEQSDGVFIALEGNTRFLHCLNNGIQNVYGVVIRGVRAELPGKPTPLKQVRITSRKHLPEERIVGFNHGLFRDIERAVRPLE